MDAANMFIVRMGNPGVLYIHTFSVDRPHKGGTTYRNKNKI